MHTKIVPAGELTTKSLLAKDYVYAPADQAKKLLERWKKEHDPGDIINKKSRAYVALQRSIALELARAKDEGRSGT